MRLRPCIDLRNGRVVQIVGGTLTTDADHGGSRAPQTNFSTDRPATEFAALYRANNLPGGHVISLGPGNQEAALSALAAYPGGMQMGGGITPENASAYLDAGASQVIVTSYVFREGNIDQERLDELVRSVGVARLVLDLSCRKLGDEYRVATDRWTRLTEVSVSRETLERLSAYCAEFLVHAVDVEGKKAGIDAALIERLAAWSPIPVTYAGGVASWEDVDKAKQSGQGRVDLTVGSALDIFGGTMRFEDLVARERGLESGA